MEWTDPVISKEWSKVGLVLLFIQLQATMANLVQTSLAVSLIHLGRLLLMTTLAAYLLPFVMTGVWGHLHPATITSDDMATIHMELRRTLLESPGQPQLMAGT